MPPLPPARQLALPRLPARADLLGALRAEEACRSGVPAALFERVEDVLRGLCFGPLLVRVGQGGGGGDVDGETGKEERARGVEGKLRGCLVLRKGKHGRRRSGCSMRAGGACRGRRRRGDTKSDAVVQLQVEVEVIEDREADWRR